jgi:hypothetical protein
MLGTLDSSKIRGLESTHAVPQTEAKTREIEFPRQIVLLQPACVDNRSYSSFKRTLNRTRFRGGRLA